MVRSFRRNRRGISPVIATIIIVAVAIVMSIAVAYWLMGLGTVFTRYENLEIPIAYPESVNGGWNITLHVKNTGSSDATINIILINGKLDGSANVTVDNRDYGPLNNTTLNISVKAGKEVVLVIELSSNNYSSGQHINIMLQTATGYQYSKAVVLP